MIEKVAQAICEASTWPGYKWDTISEGGKDRYREMADAAIATLQPVIDSWRDVATSRQELIDQLKIEKRQLAHEVDRLNGMLGGLERKYCTGCGGGFRGEHDCGRKKR